MASSSPRSSSLLFLCLSAAFLFDGASAVANITGILEKSGQFSVLIKLLSTTQVGNQLTNEINNSFQGLTLLAPNDGAFDSLKSGFLNDLSQENQVKLLMFHVLSKFYAWDDFRSVSNPVFTQASGPDGPYGLDFTYISNQQVNVSSGAVTTTFTNAVNLTKPLAVYEIGKVLYPKDKFDAAPAPTPSSSEKNATAKAAASSGGSSSSKGSSDASSKSAAASVRGQWSGLMGSLLVVMGTASVGFLL